MYVRYGDVCLPTVVGVGNSGSTPDAMIDLFLQWNIEDPVSDLEKVRNNFHENTSNTYAQGNRNPFIDNPYLATRIWGGDDAQDLWGIFISGDSEAPSSPTNVVVNNQTTTSIDLSWTASTDNVAVTGYNIYFNGTLKTQTNTTSKKISNLTPGTSYSIEIEAKDQYNNKSVKSTALNSSTTQDSTAPSVPTNLVASNLSGTGFKLSWTASTDDTAVTGYDIFVDGNFNNSTTNLNQTITGLTISTTYAVTVLAKDASDNKSTQSPAINTTTTNGVSNGITELFFSEYVEPAGGFNKALEIVNATSSIISLSGYSIKKQTNGSGDWGGELILDSGTIKNINSSDVFVIINGAADADDLIDEADLTTSSSPMNFNGNDALGLFKDGILIDQIGVFGSSTDYAKDVTLRRVATNTFPNTTFDLGEWEDFDANTFNGIGNYTSTLTISDFDYSLFKMYPNPISATTLFFTIKKEAKVTVYNILGELVKTKTISKNNNEINIASLVKGIYLVKVRTGNQFITKKLIKR
jgi:chitodextrinase